MTGDERLTEIKTAMLLHVPFFASLLLDMMEVKVTKDSTLWDDLGVTPTCATNGKRITWYEPFLVALDLKEAVFVTCHEIGHCMWMHMARAKMYADQGSFDGNPFEPRLWNIAGDYIINDMLVKSGIGQMPKVGLLDSKFTSDMLTDDVYRALFKKMPPKGGGGQQSPQGAMQGGQGTPQGGSSKGQHGNHGDTLDAHIHETTQTSEAEMKRAIATAKEAAKAMGKMPAALERMVDQYLQPKVKWREKLRHCVTRAASREASSWASPHRRRLVTQKVYLPSYTGFGAGKIVVAFDTSGSVGERELQQYMGELSDILDTCRPEEVIVVSCDAEVYPDSIQYLQEGHDLINYPPKIIGGGGTRFEPVFEWLDEEGIEPACLIYLTDLMGSFPKEEPKYPVIWAATMEGEAPFGETIFIDAKEEA
jgi:predicted metal-dependent peptidase